MSTNPLATVLDRARENTGSDNKTAQVMGVKRELLSAWRHGRNWPDFVNGVRLCCVAGIDPLELAEALANTSQIIL